jgi:hypothetical protein
VHNFNFDILSFNILLFDILSFNILSFDILSFNILSFDILLFVVKHFVIQHFVVCHLTFCCLTFCRLTFCRLTFCHLTFCRSTFCCLIFCRSTFWQKIFVPTGGQGPISTKVYITNHFAEPVAVHKKKFDFRFGKTLSHVETTRKYRKTFHLDFEPFLISLTKSNLSFAESTKKKIFESILQFLNITF